MRTYVFVTSRTKENYPIPVKKMNVNIKLFNQYQGQIREVTKTDRRIDTFTLIYSLYR